jgi:hypothetical protein
MTKRPYVCISAWMIAVSIQIMLTHHEQTRNVYLTVDEQGAFRERGRIARQLPRSRCR